MHNHYRIRAGEDFVFAEEGTLLREHGHQVVDFTTDSASIETEQLRDRVSLAVNTVWSQATRTRLGRTISEFCPDVAHVTNTFPLISPSVYYECARQRVPVVQSLHNYRFLCPAATMLLHDKPCELCIDKGLLSSVQHRCYRDSAAQTAVVASMLAIHRMLGTYATKVAAYVVLTEFARALFARGGLPEERLFVKPNFLNEDPGHKIEPGRDVLFVGRLSEEKGLMTLVDAWRRLNRPETLHIIGDGPLRHELERSAPPRVHFWGARDHDTVIEKMKESAVLVFPSQWYEGFPMVLLEAFATGTPALVSNLGGQNEMSEEGRCAMTFAAGDPDDLREKLAYALEDPSALRAMTERARAAFETKYSAQRNYDSLLRIYDKATGD